MLIKNVCITPGDRHYECMCSATDKHSLLGIRLKVRVIDVAGTLLRQRDLPPSPPRLIVEDVNGERERERER